MIFQGIDRRKKFYVGSSKVKKMYLGSVRVYSAGNYVTYYVDTDETYTEEVESDATCLSPTTFTPDKDGYTFVGWRQDTTASSSVLSSLIMDDEAITLYAVFKKTVTLTYYNGSSTKYQLSKTQYYNNGNVENPTFTLTAASVSGFSFDGWCTSSDATATIIYSAISDWSLSDSTTVYARYSQDITLTYCSTSSTSATISKTRYYNSGNYSNPTFTLANPSLTNWTFAGWVTDTGATSTVAYDTFSSGVTLTEDLTIYGKWYQTITLSYNGNSSTSGSVSKQTGTRYFNAYGNYSNPSFTLASNGYTRTGYAFSKWAKDSTSGTQYSAGASVTLSADAIFYAIWTAVDVTIFDGDTITSGYGTYYTDTLSADPDNESSVDTGTRTMFVLTGLGPFTTVKINYSYNCYVNYGTAELYINDDLVQSGSPTGLWDYRNATKTITISSSATSLTITGRAYASNDSDNTSYYARANMTITSIVVHV